MDCFYKMTMNNVQGESTRHQVYDIQKGLEWIEAPRDEQGVLVPVMSLAGFKVKYILTQVHYGPGQGSRTDDPYAFSPGHEELRESVSLEDLDGDATMRGLHEYFRKHFSDETVEEYRACRDEKPFGYEPDGFMAAITYKGELFAKIMVVDFGGHNGEAVYYIPANR